MPRRFIRVRRKGHPTTAALVVVNDVFANPPLYATGSEPQIVQQLAVPTTHCDSIRGTRWALPRPGGADCYVHWENPTTLLTLVPSGDSTEAMI